MLGVGVSSGKNRAEEAAAVRHASSIAASWILYDFPPVIELQCVSYLEDNCTAVLNLTWSFWYDCLSPCTGRHFSAAYREIDRTGYRDCLQHHGRARPDPARGESRFGSGHVAGGLECQRDIRSGD